MISEFGFMIADLFPEAIITYNSAAGGGGGLPRLGSGLNELNRMATKNLER
jgi:hypothetical protein